MKKRLATLTTVVVAGFLTIPTGTTHLSNYGVRDRTLGPTVLSRVVTMSPLSQRSAYSQVEALVPYILVASSTHSIPPNVLAAVLYVEALHRKPVDVKTFGVAQLGVGELTENGLEPDPTLLNNDELSVNLLAAKLHRLQWETGSLADAIILHNGYNDYHSQVAKAARDLRIITILNTTTTRPSMVL